MKRILCIVFIVLMVSSVLLFPAYAVGGSIFADNASGSPGDNVDITVTLSDNPGVIAMRLSVGYDSSILKLVSASDGGLLGTGTANFGNSTSSNPYVLTWEDALARKNYTNNGTLVTLRFLILNNAASGKTAITLSLDSGSTFDINLQDVSFIVNSGSVTVTKGSNQDLSSTRTSEVSAVCNHKESTWKTIKPAACAAIGQKQCVCSKCGEVINTASIPATGHKMGTWRIRTAATSTKSGTKFRRCSVCGYEETEVVPKLSTDLEATTAKVARSEKPDIHVSTALPEILSTSVDSSSQAAKTKAENGSTSATQSELTPVADESQQSEVTTVVNSTDNRFSKPTIAAGTALILIALLVAAVYITKKTRKEQSQ